MSVLYGAQPFLEPVAPSRDGAGYAAGADAHEEGERDERNGQTITHGNPPSA